MGDETTRTDCSKCAALCCMALAFDRGGSFAIDKPAGVACPHLGEDDRCSIHDRRAASGFSGCVRYDCAGAGPRALVRIGRSWRESRDARVAVMDAFFVEREVTEARSILEAASRFPLTDEEETTRASLAAELDAFTWSTVAPRIRRLVHSLRERAHCARKVPSNG